MPGLGSNSGQLPSLAKHLLLTKQMSNTHAVQATSQKNFYTESLRKGCRGYTLLIQQ